MRHARKDYERIQDPAGLIPADEPVFLLRGKDVLAPAVIGFWADQASRAGASPEIVQAARRQAGAMLEWQRVNGWQIPDMPEES